MGPRAKYQHSRRQRLVSLVGLAAAAATVGSTALTAVPASASSASQTTIIVEKTSWGSILAMSGGRTVYRLTSDKDGKSTCAAKCLAVWPAVLLAAGQKEPIGKGVSHLGFFNRGGGERQVTYEGVPLYTFIGDKKVGQITGNIKDKFGQWWVVNPAHPLSKPSNSGGTTTTVPGGGVAY